MKQKLFRTIADLRFSIFILLLISVCSILGTIIEQDQSIEIYKVNYPLTNPVLGFLTWDIILQLGLDHVYKTWWFFLLMFLFGFSLISCTFLQQFPSLKVARRCQFFRTTEQFYRLKISTILTTFAYPQILARIQQNQYSIFQQKDIVYCYKGLIGRVAPILVHISMILILFGAIVGSLFGFKAQEIVPKTEQFHIQNILTSGQLTSIPETSVRINDFWINYTKNKTISQFYSDLSVLNSEGSEIERKTISVNYPLIYKGLYYYQTDWNLIGLRFQTETNETLEYPLVNALNNQNKVWLTWLSTNSSLTTGLIVIMDNLEGYCSIYDPSGMFLGNLELNETLTVNFPLTLLEIISSTGLQIKTDFGIPIIYGGFFLLMSSTLISYITYSQIWIVEKQKQLFIGGTTNRAIFDFELEFLKFIK
uniref:Cytochrome c biogenesis protein Ccs1 n=1 Tax=Halamphora calidilacuna TaxID=2133758 RepID=A0A516ZBH3_9STRA|nr:c-type cytochrome biogenesis protein [Halamphora calidilacuna]QDR25053.1 c-type cytochrome biogenesis protein [Halamphora calidilacuna]